ncbi:MAG: glycosyltransferase [Betaproteobacteria bacterium]
MRILYVNDTMYYVVHGLLRGLERQGHEVRIVPLRLYSKLDQWWTLISEIQDFRPDLVFTPGWSIGQFDVDQYNQAIRDLRVFHVYWATEDPVFYEECSLRFAPSSDYVFTTTEELLPRYAELGKPSSLLLFGFNPEIHRPVPPSPDFGHDIILVANNYHWFSPEIECRRRAVRTVLMPVVENGFDVKVYGADWTKPDADIQIPAKFYGGHCPYLDTATAFSSAKIVLGIHSDDTSRTQTSVRTFEVLGSGAFYLTYYTPAHENLFENHKHLVWSKSPEETVELVEHYLKHDQDRRRIAAAGRRLALSQHTYDHRARDFEQAIAPFLAGHRGQTAQDAHRRGYEK